MHWISNDWKDEGYHKMKRLSVETLLVTISLFVITSIFSRVLRLCRSQKVMARKIRAEAICDSSSGSCDLDGYPKRFRDSH